MKHDFSTELDRDGLRAHFNTFTREAFQRLPKLNRPRILDIGCGTGVPSLELASVSDGEIFGIDIDEAALEVFSTKISDAGLQDRVKAVKCSLYKIDFPDENFDIVWAEGVIAIIGFEPGLREWRRLIKPHGFLVVHDNIDDMKTKHEIVPVCGYMLLDMFVVPKDIWWDKYYCPFEKRIQELRTKYRNDTKLLALLDKEQQEVEEFKKNPKYHGSVFYVMQKADS